MHCTCPLSGVKRTCRGSGGHNSKGKLRDVAVWYSRAWVNSSRACQLACESSNLLLEIGGGNACTRRFCSLGLIRALPFHRLSASTVSLHVAPPRLGHDDARSYANPSFRATARREVKDAGMIQ